MGASRVSEHGQRGEKRRRLSQWRTPHGRVFPSIALVATRLVPALLLGLVASSCSRGRGVSTFPNAPVVLISIDTLRADRLPAYGYTKVETPHLDGLRKDSWLFENAYSPCPMTFPSHVTMLTGLLPPEHGVRNNVGYVFDGSAHQSLPSLLKARGYSTGAAVSSYVLRADTGLAGQFDSYEDSLNPRQGSPFLDYQRSGYTTEAFARDWVERHSSEPFFFFLHIYEPHVPYEPPEPFRSRYGATYDAEVATADDVVGRFLEDLKRLQIYDKAVVIVTSDHGEGLGDHGEDQHSILLYLEAIKVPLLLKLPSSVGAGSTVTAPAQLSDILPTVTALLGLPTPEAVSGSSLLTLDRPGAPGRAIYGETLYPRLQLGWSDLASVIDLPYQYIRGPRPELYDITRDPRERHDLVSSDGATAARLARALERFPTGEGKANAADEETLRRLAALGYVGGLRDRQASGQLPNPVDNLKFVARMKEGWRLAGEREYPQALGVLNAIVQENPAMVEVWIKLGEIRTDMGQDVEAATAYRQALERSPVFLGDVAVLLGYAELRCKRLPEAEEAARRALATNPEKAHELLMRCSLAGNRLDEAEAHARAAAEGRNPQPPAMLLTAELLIAKGQPQQALEVVEEAEKRAQELRLPPVYRLEFQRADALARLNRLPDAEAAYGREIAAFPEDGRAYANLAVLHFLRGDRAGVDELMEAMAKASPSRRTYLLAATTYQALGNPTRAETWRRRAEAVATSGRLP
jgi:arylsulfatase A-like enzyme/Flp pilus assembly protein TadD